MSWLELSDILMQNSGIRGSAEPNRILGEKTVTEYLSEYKAYMDTREAFSDDGDFDLFPKITGSSSSDIEYMDDSSSSVEYIGDSSESDDIIDNEMSSSVEYISDSDEVEGEGEKIEIKDNIDLSKDTYDDINELIARYGVH